MMETLLQWDASLFEWINSGWTNPVFDILMPAARNKYLWIPLYVLALSWIFFNSSIRQIAYIVFFVSISIFASDTISSKFIKYQVKRARPCHEQPQAPEVIQRVACGGGYSFTSSHAANHFCLASFLVTLFGGYMRNWKYLWWIWAALISLAQVYVGLHYPLDILGGALLGMLIGIPLGILCKQKIKPFPPEPKIDRATE
jgi:membrane-associated phospholipid phosphatase